MQAGIEAERARMSAELGRLAGAAPTEVVPAQAPATTADIDIDMAERFFARAAWRSVPGVPLAVLGGMFVAGVAATGAVLRRRDLTGR
jgi:hypothetical protein